MRTIVLLYFCLYIFLLSSIVREIKLLKSLEHPNIVKLIDIVSSKGCEHIDANIKQQTLRTQQQQQQQQQQLQQHINPPKDGGAGNKQDSKSEEKERSESLSNQLKRFGNLFMVFEYIDHDLGGLIDSKLIKFSTKQVKCIAKQLFDVLAYLDARKIVHRDIKSSNILINNNHLIKLADFGLARTQNLDEDGNVRSMTNNVVTMWYKSPELLLGARRYTSAVDLWSAGCVLAEIDQARPLFPGKTEIDQINLVFRAIGTPNESMWPELVHLPLFKDKDFMPSEYFPNTFYKNYYNKISDVLLDLLNRILVADPQRRISSKDALVHAFVRDAKDPEELEPLKIDNGTSYHEFQTKQKRRQKEEERRQKEEEEAAKLLSSSSISLPDPEAIHSAPFSGISHAPIKQITAPPIILNANPINSNPFLSANISHTHNINSHPYNSSHSHSKSALPPKPLPPQPNTNAVIEYVEIDSIIYPLVIGKGGVVINDIKSKTNTFCNSNDQHVGAYRTMQIKGTRENVNSAIAMINKVIEQEKLKLVKEGRHDVPSSSSSTSRVAGYSDDQSAKRSKF